MKPPHLILIGERNPAFVAHRGIEASIALYQRQQAELTFRWLPTTAIAPGHAAERLQDATAIWAAPGGPYLSIDGAFAAIRHAREKRIPFLGTCGGFQHALMEFAQNVLGRSAHHQEIEPEAADPLIVKLACSLAGGARGTVIADKKSTFRGVLGGLRSTEEFNCNYGLNSGLESLFDGSDLQFVAHDEDGQVRAFQLAHHPFFVGTLFQPERRALTGTIHPIVEAFLRATVPSAGVAGFQ